MKTVSSTFPRLFAAAGTLAMLVCLLVAFPAPVSAHTVLVETTPANGALLSAEPAVVTLKFTQQPLSGSVALVAESASGASVQLGAPQVDATTVSAAWPAGTPGGTYRVSWRVVSPDGHPVNGTWDFSYGVAAAQPFPTQSPQPAATGESSSSVWLIVGGAVIVIVLLAVGVLLVRRKK